MPAALKSLNSAKGSGGTKYLYIPRDVNGNPIPLGKQVVNGQEVPLSEIHWTDHGRPDVHAKPHQHVFTYDFDKKCWIRGNPDFF